MANYYGTGRTTYARFKSRQAVVDFVEQYRGVVVIHHRDDHRTPVSELPDEDALLAFKDGNDDGGGWSVRADHAHCTECVEGVDYGEGCYEEADDLCYDHEVEAQFWAGIARLMAPGQMLQVSEAGAEKYRYLNGYTAVYKAIDEDDDDDAAFVDSVTLTEFGRAIFEAHGFKPEKEDY